MTGKLQYFDMTKAALRSTLPILVDQKRFFRWSCIYFLCIYMLLDECDIKFFGKVANIKVRLLTR